MSNSFLAPPARRWRLTLWLAAAVAGIAGLVVFFASRPNVGSTPAVTVVPTGSVTSSVDDGVVSVSPRPSSGAMRVVAGSRQVSGVSVGFPQSTAGALSAAVEYESQIGSTLDPQRAATVAGVVADASFAAAAEVAVAGVANARRAMALPETGPVPAGASVSLTPTQYQLRDVTRDRVLVLLLGVYTQTSTSGVTSARAVMVPLRMRWDGTDWKLLAGVATDDFTAVEAVPGSADAVAKGWLDLIWQ